MKKALFLAAVTALLLVSARADQVNLKDGSFVKGKVVQIVDGKLTIKTDSLGEVKIDFNNIANFTTDEPMVVSTTTSAATVTGKISAAEDGKTAINGTVVANTDIKNVWRPGQPDPSIPIPKPRKWKYEVAIDVAGKTGNTEKTTVGGSAKATLDGPEDKLELYVRGHYAKENGVKNEQEIVAGADYERRLNGGSHSLYARVQAEQDKFDNYKLYTTAAAGYGFYLLDKEDFKVRLRAGLTYIHKTYYEGMDDSDDIGVEFGYHHELNIRNFSKIDAKLVTDVTYQPVFDHFQDDYRVYHESALDIPLTKNGLWSIRLGVSNEYNNRVASTQKRMDTTYFGRLVITWE